MSLRSKINLIIFQTLVFSLMFALFGRLFYLQVLESDKYQELDYVASYQEIIAPGAGMELDINQFL